MSLRRARSSGRRTPTYARRALVGLNKGEAHHALKCAINFHQRGELRDRTGEGQHYRVAGLNLLAAIIIYWNRLKLGEAVFARRQAGLEIPARFEQTAERYAEPGMDQRRPIWLAADFTAERAATSDARCNATSTWTGATRNSPKVGSAAYTFPVGRIRDLHHIEM